MDVCVDESDAVVGRDLIVGFLALPRGLRHLPVEEEALSGLPSHDGLRPELVHLPGEVVPHVLHWIHGAALHDPEATVARVALQEGLLVRRGEEDALTGVGLRLAPVGGPEGVVLLGEEGLVGLGR